MAETPITTPAVRRHERLPISKRVRFDVFKRDGFRCVYCGVTPEQDELQVDHVHPVARGGVNRMDNFTTACRACNAGKSDKVIGYPRAWMDSLEDMETTLQRLVEVELTAQCRRDSWIGVLCIASECETVLKFLGTVADAMDEVDVEYHWHSPRFIEIVRGLAATGYIGGARPVELTPRGTVRLKLGLRAFWPRDGASDLDQRKLEFWFDARSFGRVEDIHG